MKLFLFVLGVWGVLILSAMSSVNATAEAGQATKVAEVAETSPERALIQKDHTNDGYHLLCGGAWELPDGSIKAACYRVKSPTRAADDPMTCEVIGAGTAQVRFDCGKL